MTSSNVQAINHDIQTLVKDAQALLHSATSLTGEKAEEVRVRGVRMLDAALVKAQEAHASALAASKEIAASADTYVKDNPWRVLAVATGVALLVGAIIGRK